MSVPTDRAKAMLESRGYVVLREKSYRQAQERQRVAEALRKLEEEHNVHTREWAHRAFDEMRRLSDRCTYLYGLAARHGATESELAQYDATVAEPVDRIRPDETPASSSDA
jgi:hypothetical protein